jgi:hypothetical protein
MSRTDVTSVSNNDRHLEIANCSIVVGDPIRMRIIDFVCPAPAQLVVVGSLIGQRHTSWAFSAEGVLHQEGTTTFIEFQSTLDAVGLYRVDRVEFRSDQGSVHLDSSEADDRLFEIRHPEVAERTAEALRLEQERIIQDRQRELHAGIGDGPRQFTVVVFAKDCLVTTRMQLGPYQIEPRPGLSSEDELQAVRGFLSERGVENFDPGTEWERVARIGEPCTVLTFPVVRGDSPESAFFTALREADLLLALLSLHRGGYGSIFSALLQENGSGQIAFWFNHESYTGNYLGGFTSGEEPDVIVQNMNTLRSSPSAQLYVALLREAMREKDSEFKYFRLWGILETIARAKGYTGEPKREWNGSVVLNRQGIQRRIQDTAEELVFELLRRTLPNRGLDESSFASTGQQAMIGEQIPLWYRRRNCVAHGGPCLCRSPHSSLTEAKFQNCKRARDEMRDVGDDIYLRTLQRVVEAVVEEELRS